MTADHSANAGSAASAAPTGEEDDELMRRVQNGEVEILGLLFDRYHAQLFRFYVRMTGDRAAAEDLVQDVFFRVLKYRNTYQPGSRFVTWMYQVARNARLDFARKRQNEVALDEQPEPLAAREAPADRVVENEQRALLRRALMRLPAERREVLVLARYEELPYEQIALVLGCQTGAVKVRVHRALHELRTIFFELTGRKRL